MSQPKGKLFREELLDILREASSRDPIFEAIQQGQLSREALKLWMLQASLIVEPFTRFVSGIHANCPHRDAQALLAENLWEEHGKGKIERDHYRLIQRLAKSLGATDEELHSVAPLPETTAYVNFCLRITHDQSFVEGMTAIGVGIEYSIPQFFAMFARSLQTNYGLSKNDVEYLLIHIGEDEDHAERALAIIEKFADTREAQEKAKAALREMLGVKGDFSRALYQMCLNAS
ncbi:MAG: iron-containing redox enzyme family protein [Acidobacteriota bacterium]